MTSSIHHVHLFASDLDASISFYRNHFDGKVVLDMPLAGARNVFMQVGAGRIHFYDQPPKRPGAGSIHHFGIQTDDLDNLVERLRADGVEFRKGITEAGQFRYIMVPAPDDVLIELFEVDLDAIPDELRPWFDL